MEPNPVHLCVSSRNLGKFVATELRPLPLTSGATPNTKMVYDSETGEPKVTHSKVI